MIYICANLDYGDRVIWSSLKHTSWDRANWFGIDRLDACVSFDIDSWACVRVDIDSWRVVPGLIQIWKQFYKYGIYYTLSFTGSIYVYVEKFYSNPYHPILISFRCALQWFEHSDRRNNVFSGERCLQFKKLDIPRLVFL